MCHPDFPENAVVELTEEAKKEFPRASQRLFIVHKVRHRKPESWNTTVCLGRNDHYHMSFLRIVVRPEDIEALAHPGGK